MAATRTSRCLGRRLPLRRDNTTLTRLAKLDETALCRSGECALVRIGMTLKDRVMTVRQETCTAILVMSELGVLKSVAALPNKCVCLLNRWRFHNAEANLSYLLKRYVEVIFAVSATEHADKVRVNPFCDQLHFKLSHLKRSELARFPTDELCRKRWKAQSADSLFGAIRIWVSCVDCPIDDLHPSFGIAFDF